MLALARIGVTSAEFYVRQWRVAIVVIAALAAILPGGDPFSMLLLMIPQVVLYGLGIVLARRFGGPPLWARDAWADAAGRRRRGGAPTPRALSLVAQAAAGEAQEDVLEPRRAGPPAGAPGIPVRPGGRRSSASASSLNSSTRSPSMLVSAGAGRERRRAARSTSRGRDAQLQHLAADLLGHQVGRPAAAARSGRGPSPPAGRRAGPPRPCSGWSAPASRRRRAARAAAPRRRGAPAGRARWSARRAARARGSLISARPIWRRRRMPPGEPVDRVVGAVGERHQPQERRPRGRAPRRAGCRSSGRRPGGSRGR